MRRLWGLVWAGLLGLLVSGCASGPLLDNPLVVRPATGTGDLENPLYIPMGPAAYGAVFEKTLDILGEYFQFDPARTSRYDGRIKTFAKIAPGCERFFLKGSPDCEQRTLATFQTIRQFAEVEIQVADDDGFFVQVRVFKELEDLPRPARASSGAAVFRNDNTVERQFEVVEGGMTAETNWIPIGRDHRLEQVILQRIKKSM